MGDTPDAHQTEDHHTRQDDGGVAVVVVHGIGNQEPMDTVTALVDNVFGAKSGLHPPARVELRLDRDAEFLDLRRPVLVKSARWPKTDFFELYWQPTFGVGDPGSVLSWVVRLLRTNARGAQMRRVILTVRVAIVAVLFVAAAVTLAGWLLIDREDPWVKGIASAAWIAAVLTFIARRVKRVVDTLLSTTVADASRWFHPGIEDIEPRDKVRRAARDLLLQLHAALDDDKAPVYRRIVVVAHSLGSVVAYDAIRLAFDDLREPSGTGAPGGGLPEQQPRAWEFATAEPGRPKEGGPALPLLAGPDYQAMQDDLQREQERMGVAWRVTDFITVGSPLTHALDLMSNDRETFAERKASNEFPACPPVGEQQHKEQAWADRGNAAQPAAGADGTGPVAFYRRRVEGPLVAHEASPFAGTRWTNLYFPMTWRLGGDPVGGPLEPLFGRGVVDLPVELSAPRAMRERLLRKPVAAHTRYWRREGSGHEDPDKDCVQVLRRAMNLSWES